MRMIAALDAAHTHLDLRGATRLLGAPAEEAVLYGIRQLGESLQVGSRRPLHRLVHDPRRSAEDEVRLLGTWALDRLAAAEFRSALADLMPGHEVVQTPAHEEILKAQNFENADVTITTTVFLPASVSLDDVPDARTQIGMIAKEPELLPLLARLAKTIADVAGSNRSSIEDGDGQKVTLWVDLGKRPLSTFVRLMEPLDAAAKGLESATLRSRRTDLAAFDIVPIERATGRIDLIRAAFPEMCFADGANGTRYAVLATDMRTPEGDELVISFGVCHDTTRIFDQGRGWVVGLTLGDSVLEDDEARSAFLDGLAYLLQWKFGLDTTRINPDSDADPDLAHVWRGDPASTVHYAMQTPGTEPESAGWLVGMARRLGTFLRRLAELLEDGADPFEVVGLSGAAPRPAGADLEEDEPTIEVPSEDIIAAHQENLLEQRIVPHIPFPGVTVREPETEAPAETETEAQQPNLARTNYCGTSRMDATTTQVWIPARDAKPEPEPPPHIEPMATRAPAHKQPEAPPGLAATSPLDDKGLSPADVVKSLSDHVELVDVFLRSVGHNISKLAQIMTILLQLEPGKALEIIERAPCNLLEGVPRDRSRTIKTVLQGTGAKITVTPHGEQPPPLDDEE
jgi:hypothetical protein